MKSIIEIHLKNLSNLISGFDETESMEIFEFESEVANKNSKINSDQTFKAISTITNTDVSSN